MSYSRALIVIDYTMDFVAEEGALTCGEPGQKIEGAIYQLIETYQAAGDFVYLPSTATKKEMIIIRKRSCSLPII